MSTGELKVSLVDASGLKGADFVGTISPYVVIQFSDHELKSRTAHDQGGDPVWNETFAFPVSSSPVDDPIQNKLILRIMDADAYTDDDFIGQATVRVGEVIALGMEEGFADLEPANYRVVLEDESYCGEIKVGVRFTTQVEEN